MRFPGWFAGLILLGCVAGTTAPTSAPATAVFEDSKAGFRMCYPADWQPEKGSTSVLDVAAPGDTECASLSLDIPKLPWHPLGFLPLREIQSGYVDDLRKNEIPDAKIDESIDVTVHDASARRVKCSGHENGKEMIDVAVLIVHADRVYIVSCDSDDAGRQTARSALDAAVASIQWMKK